MANACQCGCGELLPEGSVRQYKRGHKSRVTDPESGFTETTDTPEDEPAAEAFTIEDAARETPDDPEPKDQPAFKPRTQIRITAAIRRDVEGKIAFAFAMTGAVWAGVDPVCGTAFLDHSPDIAKKLTPILCQSPEVVKWLTKSSSFMLWADLAMACWPVVQIIFAHHIAKTVAANVPSANGNAPAPNEYVVQ